MHVDATNNSRRPQATTAVRSARFATKLFLQEALGCRATRVWLPGLYCPKVAGALNRLGLRLAYYDLDSDLAPLAPSETSAAGTASSPACDLVIGFYPFGLARSMPAQFLAERRFVLDACHALRTVLNGAEKSGRGPVVVSLRKEFGGKGKAWSFSQRETSWRGSINGDWPLACLSSETAQGHAATRRAVSALGPKLPTVGAKDVLTHLPLLAADRDAAIKALRAKGIDAWYWQRPLPGWSSDTVPHAARLQKSLLLIPTRRREDETERLLDTLQTLDLCRWRQASDTGRTLRSEFFA